VALEHGDYLTNGASLFRFECWLPNKEGVVLEDASTDRVWSVSIKDFTEMKLKAVKPLQRGIKVNA
jgi:hypothetical protein